MAAPEAKQWVAQKAIRAVEVKWVRREGRPHSSTVREFVYEGVKLSVRTSLFVEGVADALRSAHFIPPGAVHFAVRTAFQAKDVPNATALDVLTSGVPPLLTRERCFSCLSCTRMLDANFAVTVFSKDWMSQTVRIMYVAIEALSCFLGTLRLNGVVELRLNCFELSLPNLEYWMEGASP